MRTAAGALLKKVHAAQGHGSAPSPRPESGRAPLTFPGTYRWSCRARARKRFSSYIGPRFAARATPIVARNYAFLAACFEAYEMCILFASLHSQQFRTCSSRCVLILRVGEHALCSPTHDTAWGQMSSSVCINILHAALIIARSFPNIQ